MVDPCAFAIAGIGVGGAILIFMDGAGRYFCGGDEAEALCRPWMR